jgi:hypothetical protein
MNSQLTGVNHNDRYIDFKSMAQRWRLAYAAVTCYQDGPDLSNQGTIVVSQSAVAPRRHFGGVQLTPFGTMAETQMLTRVMPPIETYTAEDYPSYTISQSMPNAYFNQSKFGAYVPMKLTNTHQVWRSSADDVLCASGYSETPNSGNAGSLTLAATSGVSEWPHPNCTRVHADTPHTHAGSPAANSMALGGTVTASLCNGSVAHICARNLSVSSSYSFFLRFGFEINVSPGTVLSPQQKLSPHYDRLAIDAYFAVVRELKDAYPADYNDLGKIWDVIKAGLQAAKPYLGAVPGWGSYASGIASGIVSVGDAMRSASTSSRVSAKENRAPSASRDPPSAADIERARAASNIRNIVGQVIGRKPGKGRSRKGNQQAQLVVKRPVQK